MIFVLMTSVVMTIGVMTVGVMTTVLMTWGVPAWWAATLLAAAAYRLWRLAALDTVVEPLRRRMFRYGDDTTLAPSYREGLDDFVGCAWCFGYWVAAAWWAAWLLWPHATLVAATPFALSAVVGLLSKLD